MHAVARLGFGVVLNFAVVQDLVSDRGGHLFHFVRKDTSHLSETVSGLFGRYDYYTVFDDKKIFF